jgi:hypothetical protein
MAVQYDREAEDLVAEWSSDLEAVLYQSEVEEAIREVCPTSDPLDSKDFDPIDYINQLFPTEQSLAGIDDTMTRMRVKMRTLDEEIRTVVRGQADVGHDGRQALEEAQLTIQELFGRIRNIKEKAEHSEHMVKKITSDIKQLDNAKRHLTDSVRTLERLRFLITCLEDLQRNFRQRNYAEVSTQLHGAVSVVEEFQKYKSIPQIRELMARLQSIQVDLGQQIKVDFERSFSTKGTPKGTKAELHDACLVMETLGGNQKDSLVKWFVRLQLSDYEVMFHDSLEVAWLDKVDRRYAWFRRTLVTYEEECSSIFPTEWGIPERVAIEFCNNTRSGLTNQMSSRSGDLDVKLLLYAIQKTTSFEKTLAQRFFQSPYMEEKYPSPEVHDASSREEEEEEFDHEEAPGSRRKRKMFSVFQGMISRCFEPHLNVYITSQDKNLSELIENFVSDLKSRGRILGAGEGGGAVLPSAADLFIFYKKCLVQCVSLSTGPALLDLTELFRRYLKEYSSRILTASLPKVSSSSSGSKLTLGGLRKDTTPDPTLSREDLTITCILLCTADYCLETTSQLETKLKEKIDSSLVEKVDFSQEQERFHSLISSCTQLLVQDMENACTVAFTAMVKMPWQSVDTVGDQSSYVSSVVAHVRNNIPHIRENLTPARKYFVNFCHKLANATIPTFITHLYKCKPISTIAAEQLLLDTHSLKTMLLELPSVGAAIARKPPASYSKLVQKGMEKAELIVKVVMSPHERAEEFLSSYNKLMQGDPDIANFQKVLEMKGLKRSEQHALIELFKTKVASSTGVDHVHSHTDKFIQPIKKLEKLMRF